jgi:GntR family transcriptional regulator/MocR family aminotransferase
MVKRSGGALLTMIRIDPGSGRTIGSQLAAALRQAILEGHVLAGERLPATRVLAAELGLARTTVVEAFESLISEGLLETRTGSGTFVTATSVPLTSPTRTAGAEDMPRTAQPERLARLMAAAQQQFADRLGHVPRAFTTAMPDYDMFPMAQWARLLNRHWQGDRSAILGYHDALGHPGLRAAIARHLRGNRGFACEPSQVFVTSGAQQAFQLIGAMLLDPGDAVWFEDPGAIGARNSFVVHGAHVVPVGIDEEGLDVADGLAMAPDFKLAFVTPSHQQPLGFRMSHERRIALLRAAAKAGAFVVEDDWDGDFTLSGRPAPALKAIDAGERVIYVGSFSKSMFPALRIGYLVAPPSLIPTFEVALRAFSAGVPTSLQAAVAGFIDEGLFAAHLRRMCKLYGERQEVLVAAAASELSPWLDIQPTLTGMHALATLKRGLNGETVARRADAAGVTVSPVSRFCLQPRATEALVLGFSGFNAQRITGGVKLLAQVFKSVERERSGGMSYRQSDRW